MKNKSLLLLFCGLSIVAGIVIGYYIPKTSPQKANTTSEQAALSKQPATNVAQFGDTPDIEAPTSLTSADIQALTIEQKTARIDRLKDTSSITGTIEMLTLLTTMSESELQKLLADSSKNGMGSINDFFVPYYIFQAWVDKNPESAFSFYQNESNPMQKQMFAQSLFAAWGNRDPDGALVAAQAIENKNERSQAIAAIAMSVAGKDPEAAQRAGRESSRG
ncbi:MAG: hypothetical protein NWS00_08505, partial [Opitutales bacterium]|nr:hypothetical protein [Opitutales bacterium]